MAEVISLTLGLKWLLGAFFAVLLGVFVSKWIVATVVLVVLAKVGDALSFRATVRVSEADRVACGWQLYNFFRGPMRDKMPGPPPKFFFG